MDGFRDRPPRARQHDPRGPGARKKRERDRKGESVLLPRVVSHMKEPKWLRNGSATDWPVRGVYMTHHAQRRAIERGIDFEDIRAMMKQRSDVSVAATVIRRPGGDKAITVYKTRPRPGVTTSQRSGIPLGDRADRPTTLTKVRLCQSTRKENSNTNAASCESCGRLDWICENSKVCMYCDVPDSWEVPHVKTGFIGSQ